MVDARPGAALDAQALGPLRAAPPVRIRQRTQLGDRFEAMRVEDLGAIAAIEALDVRVLIRLPTTLMGAPA
jgi:hypothetical protein